MKLIVEIFCMDVELFITEFNLMSFSFYSNDCRRSSLLHPLPFESVFWGYVYLRHSYGKIRLKKTVTKIHNSWESSVERFGPILAEFKCLS